MKKANQGMALITVLIFMQIWTLLGICSLEMAWLMKKINAGVHQKNQIQFAGETILKQAENKMNQDSSHCLVNVMSTSELLSKSLVWWQSHSNCKGLLASLPYYYIAELIGEDPCGYFKSSSIAKDNPAYFRISVLIYKNNPMILQSTIILPVTKTATCVNAYHEVYVGRQMWRHLSTVIQEDKKQ
jgi:hypothetical protein